jgi:ribosomal protein S27AE
MVRTEFFQECPVCGRSLLVRVAYLGRRVKCGHCGGRFIAAAAGSKEPAPSEELLARAEQLLTQSSIRLVSYRAPAGC